MHCNSKFLLVRGLKRSIYVIYCVINGMQDKYAAGANGTTLVAVRTASKIDLPGCGRSGIGRNAVCSSDPCPKSYRIYKDE